MDTAAERSRTIALIKILTEDVMAAQNRLQLENTQTTRREIVRSSLAAIEGLIWLSREHVRIVLESVGELSPIAELAFKEQSYSLAENGKLNIQFRNVPLTTAIRFVASQAAHISSEVAVDFSTAGWSAFKQAITIRNRITHPRPESDLTIEDSDLRCVASGLAWLIATVDHLMTSTNLALIRHGNEFRELYARLQAGDPVALADYNSILGDGND